LCRKVFGRRGKRKRRKRKRSGSSSSSGGRKEEHKAIGSKEIGSTESELSKEKEEE